MSLLRILLLLFMALLILVMAAFPGLHDTKRRAKAVHHYIDNPGPETQREIDEAKKIDGHEIIIFQCVLSGIFGFSVFAFVRAGRSLRKNTAPDR